MSDLTDRGLEDSPFSDFLGFELLLEEEERELVSGVRAFMTREVEQVINPIISVANPRIQAAIAEHNATAPSPTRV